MSTRFTLTPSPLYRRLGPGPALVLDMPSGPLQVEPGDWIDQTLVQRLDRAGRARLGPTTSAAHVERSSGVRPEQGQHHVRAAKVAAPAPSVPGIGVVVLGDDLALAEATAREAEGAAHVPIVTGWGPKAWEFIGDDIPNVVQIRAGETLGTGWLAEKLHEARDLLDPGIGLRVLRLGAGTRAELLADLREFLTAWPDADYILAVDEDAEVCNADELAILATLGPPRLIFPAHNLGEPCSLPMLGDEGPPWPRLAGGKHPEDIAAGLLADNALPVPGRPAKPGAVLLRRDVAEAIARGEAPPAESVICMTAFCWRPYDRPGPVAELVGVVGETAAWAPVVDRARRAVAATKPRGLPVALYSSNVGPWGGVGVLFRLADELQRLGLSAAVVHHSTTPHNYRPMTSPLKVRNASALVTDWPGEVGWRDGILVGSHWGSGRGVAEIVARHPGVIPTSFLQDREDLFEDESGRPAGMAKYREYLQIGRGVSVARWIIDSAAAELGLKPEGYQVIPPGIDCEVFRPAPRRASGGPIRIVAMWRPQTAIRRGIARLRATYEALHRRFGARVSLEVFGWNAPSGPGRAPDFVRHHGHLSQFEVAALMAQADIVVEPSALQGYGLSGVEAMACGCAVVSTDCLGPREYIVNGENAIMVPHDELADAVCQVVDDENLRNRLRSNAVDSIQWLRWEYVGAEWACYLGELWDNREPHHDAAQRSMHRAMEILSSRPARPPGLPDLGVGRPAMTSFGSASVKAP